MNKRLVFSIICLVLLFVTALFSLNLKRVSASQASGEKTLILYDAASGAIPVAQMMNFFGFPSSEAVPKYENGATVLDTTTSGNDTYAGWVSNEATTVGFPILDRSAGFQVDFTVQVETESHANNNRAGFSLIILSEDAKGIELAFWENEIWAQNDDKTGGLFKHGEATTFTSTTGLANFQVTVLNDGYTLTADGAPILNGQLRDYSRFEGFPDPYQTPNFLFLGDNTTSAQARVRLSYISVTGTEPATPVPSPSASSSPTPPSSSATSPPGSPTPPVNITPTLISTAPANDFEPCLSGGLLLVVMAIGLHGAQSFALSARDGQALENKQTNSPD